MMCELCGKETDRTTPVQIENTTLRVCRECSRFGNQAKTSTKDAPNKTIIQSRLENRERRMRQKDVYEATGEVVSELAEDYPDRIKKAREANGWKQEELAAKMNERLSLVQKVERGDIKPTDELLHKLERTLGIKLMDQVPLIKPEKKAIASQGMTLEDFIKKPKK